MKQSCLKMILLHFLIKHNKYIKLGDNDEIC